MSNQAFYLSLCPTNIVWITKTKFVGMNIHYLQRFEQGITNVNKEKYNFHLLPRLTNQVSNSQNSDRTWRPI